MSALHGQVIPDPNTALNTAASRGLRETMRCPHKGCGLFQYVSLSRNCRRCRKPLDQIVELEAPKPAFVAPSKPIDPAYLFNLDLAMPIVIFWLRNRNNLSQRDLGNLLGVARTYIAKIEGGNTLPNIDNAKKIAGFLNVDPPTMMRMCEFLANGQ